MTRSGVVALAWDLAVVITFVLFGRETHQSPFDIAESTRVMAPFTAGLGLAWLLPTVRNSPLRLMSGVIAGVVTVAVGIALRALAFGDGISGAFPVVATAYIVGLMAGYRVIPAVKTRRQI